MSFKLVLLLIGGLGWTIIYIDAIRLGFRDKTYAIPFLALAFNVTWEFYNTIQGYLYAGFHVTTFINLIWLTLDVLIVYTYFKYGNHNLNYTLFYIQTITILFLFLIFRHLIGVFFGKVNGALFSAFIENIIMSILFIRMFFIRKGLKGQSLLIAISKCIGNVSLMLLVGLIGINRLGGPISLVFEIGLFTLLADLWYIYLILNHKYTHKIKS